MRHFCCGIYKLRILQGFLIPSKLSNLHGHGGIAAKITKMWKYVISKLFCIVLKNWYNEEG